MIFIFGFHPKVTEIGPVEEIQCEHCNNTKHWILTKSVSYISFFFIPLIPVKFEFFQYCPICRNRQDLSKEEFIRKEAIAGLNKEAVETDMSDEEYQKRLNSL